MTVFKVAITLYLSEFISRHSIDGKFTFIDQRVIGILGYSPAELLGKPCFQFFHAEDQTHMKESFEQGNLFFSFFVSTLIET